MPLAADVSGSAEQAGRLQEESRAEEPPGDDDLTRTELTEPSGEQPEGPNTKAREEAAADKHDLDRAESRESAGQSAYDEASEEPLTKADAEDNPNAVDNIAGRDRPMGELFVGGKTLREHLDPAGAAAWSNQVEDKVPDPTDRMGDWIADTENKDPERTNKEKFDSFRKKFNKERDSIVEKAGKTTSRVQDLMGKRPPTGHLESRAGPDMSPAPTQGLDAGSVLTTTLAAGIMAAEAIRKIREKSPRTRRR